jgi:hypothetical protein
MVHFTTSNGQRFPSYGYRNSIGLLNRVKSGQIVPFSISPDLGKFRHDLYRNLNMKIAVNELSFSLVTHTNYSDARFDSYGILKSGQGAKDFLDKLDILTNDQVLRAEDT